MNPTVSQTPLTALQEALNLAQAVETQQEAQEIFSDLCQRFEHQPDCVEMLQLLWREHLAAQRSVAFWKELCQVEKHLSERITENHIQLKQNYLRLMQEQ